MNPRDDLGWRFFLYLYLCPYDLHVLVHRHYSLALILWSNHHAEPDRPPQLNISDLHSPMYYTSTVRLLYGRDVKIVGFLRYSKVSVPFLRTDPLIPRSGSTVGANPLPSAHQRHVRCRGNVPYTSQKIGNLYSPRVLAESHTTTTVEDGHEYWETARLFATEPEYQTLHRATKGYHLSPHGYNCQATRRCRYPVPQQCSTHRKHDKHK